MVTTLQLRQEATARWRSLTSARYPARSMCGPTAASGVREFPEFVSFRRRGSPAPEARRRLRCAWQTILGWSHIGEKAVPACSGESAVTSVSTVLANPLAKDGKTPSLSAQASAFVPTLSRPESIEGAVIDPEELGQFVGNLRVGRVELRAVLLMEDVMGAASHGSHTERGVCRRSLGAELVAARFEWSMTASVRNCHMGLLTCMP